MHIYIYIYIYVWIDQVVFLHSPRVNEPKSYHDGFRTYKITTLMFQHLTLPSNDKLIIGILFLAISHIITFYMVKMKTR